VVVTEPFDRHDLGEVGPVHRADKNRI
jgi:hypothetical protein